MLLLSPMATSIASLSRDGSGSLSVSVSHLENRLERVILTAYFRHSLQRRARRGEYHRDICCDELDTDVSNLQIAILSYNHRSLKEPALNALNLYAQVS